MVSTEAGIRPFSRNQRGGGARTNTLSTDNSFNKFVTKASSELYNI